MKQQINRYLLALLFLTTSHLAVAQSGVSLYGQVDAWVGAQSALGQSHAWVQAGGGMSTSFWGLKGSEDLGNGTQAVFALESFFRPQTGAAGSFDGEAFFARSAYVGLNTSYGKFTIGRLISPYFISTVVFNPFIDSYTFSPVVMHTYLGQGGQGLIGGYGWDHAVMATTPTYKGLNASLIYAFGGQPGQPGQNKWGGNLLYLNGPVGATLAYQRQKFNNLPGDLGTITPGFSAQDAWQLGLSYDFSLLKVYAQYQYIDNQITTGDVRMQGGQVGASIPLGNGNMLASFMQTRSTGATQLRRNTWAVGYDYSLSKLTDIYIAYNGDKITGLSSGSTYGVGMRMRF